MSSHTAVRVFGKGGEPEKQAIGHRSHYRPRVSFRGTGHRPLLRGRGEAGNDRSWDRSCCAGSPFPGRPSTVDTNHSGRTILQVSGSSIVGCACTLSDWENGNANGRPEEPAVCVFLVFLRCFVLFLCRFDKHNNARSSLRARTQPRRAALEVSWFGGLARAWNEPGHNEPNQPCGNQDDHPFEDRARHRRNLSLQMLRPFRADPIEQHSKDLARVVPVYPRSISQVCPTRSFPKLWWASSRTRRNPAAW